MIASASFSVFPRSFGRSTLEGPVLSRIVTCDPLSTFVPCGGLVSITWPFGIVFDALCWTLVMKPALCSVDSAEWRVAVRTSGMATCELPPWSCW